MSQITTFLQPSGPGSGTVTSVTGGTGINITGVPTINPTVNLDVPVVIANGGTNAITFANTFGVVYFDGTRLVNTTVGTAGQILTSNGVGVAPTFQAPSGSTIVQTITGNTGGPISPAAGNINIVTANATPQFAGAGSTETLDFGLSNLVLGSSLVSLAGGISNVGVGNNVLDSVTSSSENVAIGFNTLIGLQSGDGNNTVVGAGSATALVSGSFNTIIGDTSGNNYTTSESSNIIIDNTGTTGESNTIRIGTQGAGNSQQNRFFAAGIANVATSNSEMVTIDTTTGQLGSDTIPTGFATTFNADSGSATPSAGAITIAGGLNITTSAATSIVTIAASQAQYLTNYGVANASPYVATSTDFYITVDTSTIPITIQLPDAPTIYRRFVIKDSAGNAAAQNVTVTTVSGVKLIDAATTFVLNTDWQAAEFVYDNFGYQIF